MNSIAEIEQGIDGLLAAPPYGGNGDAQQRRETLLALFKQELAYACEQNPRFRNYVEHWPVDFREPGEVKRTLTSSATPGQIPSRIVLDAATSRRMTKGVLTIVRDFIGSARRP